MANYWNKLVMNVWIINEKAVELNPSNEKYLHGYAKYLNKIKNYKKCFEIYEKLIKLNGCNDNCIIWID